LYELTNQFTHPKLIFKL